MGNGRSCFAANSGARPAAGTALVFGPDGSAGREVEVPVTAAEIMLEAFGHVVARAEELARTRRVSGILLAEEELRAGEAYLLLPAGAGRKGSRLTDWQMDVVLEALGRKKSDNKETTKKKQQQPQLQALIGRRVFPEAAGDDGEVDEEVRKMEVSTSLVTQGAAACRRSRRRQWRPTLDTIHEFCH